MSEMTAKPVDSRVLELASELTESSSCSVPVLLLKLKEILKSAPAGSKELQRIKEDLYNYGLIQYCVLVQKQDYSRVKGGWTTAASLADILSSCCVGLNPKNDAEEFRSKILPSAILNMLVLGRRIQARYVRCVKDEERTGLFRCFRQVMDSLCWLFSGHVQLTENVFRQEHFLQLLMTDDVETGTSVMSVLQNILRANSVLPSQVPEDTLHPILDELVYKLSASSNPVIGNAATRSLLLILESSPDIVRLVGTRYKGLRSLLSKQWTGKGFGRELSRLLDLLYSTSYQQQEMQRLHRAALTIQAAWRGFLVRKRVKKLPRVVTSLQRSFRAKREQEMTQRQMEKHMQEIQERSALIVQKQWRGYKARRHFHLEKQTLKQFKAAVTIQRAALRFLNRRRRLRESLSPWKKQQDLSDEQRQRLQQKVDTHLQLHPAQQRSPEQSQELHAAVQEKLGQFLLKRKHEQRAEQRREALLAQINTDINMLMGAPSLKEATDKDIDLFTSRSIPVALKAKQSHSTMLKRSRWPWWKKLSDEFVEEDDSFASNIPDLDHGIIFIAGSKKP
ncbi:PREDICTED: IQ calmodulin-binding motif-containing protein 1 [Nanorana parkeri]|uniref:IQ calmodulin-binding motif-containing protein 1 n=1 Tax=Nanorana parkeri TaxID=125878 RepID=UPI000854D8A3|nr:PREDICTED: IQ calmodulin-binding motif-containing protein 1 [Nanorana parkeri]